MEIRHRMTAIRHQWPISDWRLLIVGSIALLFALFGSANAQQSKVHRLGIILHGGPLYQVIDGLRAGLKETGLAEGKQIIFEIRDTKGNLKAVEEAAKTFERQKVDLIYAVNTSVTLAVKRATTHIPVVFYAGADPVALGLVDSFAKPGGRLTGVHSLVTDLTAKRLEILKETFPNLQRVVTFYDPTNPVAQAATRLGREEARRLHVDFVERHIASVAELKSSMQALRHAEADAFLMLSDAMVLSQDQLIIDIARAKRLPTMFWEGTSADRGGLVSYGASYYESGRASAKHVQRILAGANPKDLPVEGSQKLELVVNLKTAAEIGVRIPPNVLARADRVIR